MTAYERIINKEKREATIRMYGIIGRDVDGNQMAHDLAELDNEADTIHILINSDGGSVSQGLSIVAAILSAKAYIHAHVGGIAASMAAVIAVSADKVSMQDYAKLMIHDPFYQGKGKEKLSKKDVKALDSVTDTLRTILSRRGCDKDRVASLMKEETWFSAQEAQTAGLVDEVVTTSRKEELSNLSVPELMSRIMNEYQSSKKTEMKEIAKVLGLPENATEQQILDAIRAKETATDEREQSLVAGLLALGKKNGTVTEKNEERMKRLASADFELFAEMVTDTPDAGEEVREENENGGLTTRTSGQAESSRLSEVLNKVRKDKNGKGSPKEFHNWDWYQKHDHEALLRMEREDPARFKALLDEYESSIV